MKAFISKQRQNQMTSKFVAMAMPKGVEDTQMWLHRWKFSLLIYFCPIGRKNIFAIFAFDEGERILIASFVPVSPTGSIVQSRGYRLPDAITVSDFLDCHKWPRPHADGLNLMDIKMASNLRFCVNKINAWNVYPKLKYYRKCHWKHIIHGSRV